MKNKYLLAFVCAGLVGLNGFAQVQKASLTTQSPAKSKIKTQKGYSHLNKDYEDAIIYEDFDGGLPEGWVSEIETGEVGFEWTNTGAVGGFLNNLQGTTSIENGWVIVDSDGYGSTGASELATLTTSSYDLSDQEYITLSIEQYYVAFNSDVCEIGYSIDGGATFNYIVVNDQYAGNTGTDNPELLRINLSSQIAGESDVVFQFRWTGAWDYGWQFDDFALVTPYDNDLELTDEYYDEGVLIAMEEEWLDVDYLEQIEYGRYLVGQVRPLTFVGEIYNAGVNTQHNVALSVTVDVPGDDPDETFVSGYIDLEPGDTAIVTIDDIMLDAFADGGSVGDYTVEFTAISDSTDNSPEDNVSEKTFEVNEEVMDIDNLDNVWETLFPTLFESVIYGTRYLFTEEVEVNYIQFVIGESVSQGYDSEENVLFPNIRVGSAFEETTTETLFDPYEVEFLLEDDDISSGSTAIWITVPLPEPVVLNPNTVYQAEFFSPDGPVFAGCLTDQPWYTGIAGEVATDGQVTWSGLGTNFDVAPLIRFGTDGTTSVGNVQQLKFKMGQSFPNPSNGSMRIDWELLEAAENVMFKVTDINGKTVYAEDLGNRAAGVQSPIVLDLDLASGVYQYSLQVGNNRMVRKMVITE